MKEELVRARIRVPLDLESELEVLHEWFDRWRDDIAQCTRSGGVWEDRFELVAPPSALGELSERVSVVIVR